MKAADVPTWAKGAIPTAEDLKLGKSGSSATTTIAQAIAASDTDS